MMYAMQPVQRMVCRTLVFTGVLLSPLASLAFEFEPGVGVGLEYSDNVTLSADNAVNDLMAVGYVGARIAENEGPLTYGASTSLNKTVYTQDTFEDQRYFNLAANADWEVVRDTFNLNVRDYFNQRTVVSLNANTPDNLQDSNIFTLGANYRLLLSPRQFFSLVPTFTQYYYEVLTTDNKQYALNANWNYQLFRVTNVGINLGIREINYTETDPFGQSIANTTFTNAAFVISSKRSRSEYVVNLGATNVKRDGGGDNTGFTGSALWQVDVSSRSTFKVRAATDLTDTSSVTRASAEGPVPGNPDDVQIATDVIRNNVFNLTYLREDASLRTRVWGEFRELLYSESPLDRQVRTVGASLSYPFTQLLTSSTYANYSRTNQLDTLRQDERYTLGGNLKYNFTRKIHSLFDIKYRTKESTDNNQNYQEFSVFFSLVYGFGEVYRPSRSGGF